MANEKNRPQCSHCFGTNWEKIAEIIGGDRVVTTLWQCGHGPANAEEMKNGCSRIIAATEDQMARGGVI